MEILFATVLSACCCTSTSSEYGAQQYGPGTQLQQQCIFFLFSSSFVVLYVLILVPVVCITALDVGYYVRACCCLNALRFFVWGEPRSCSRRIMAARVGGGKPIQILRSKCSTSTLFGSCEHLYTLYYNQDNTPPPGTNFRPGFLQNMGGTRTTTKWWLWKDVAVATRLHRLIARRLQYALPFVEKPS